MSGNPPRGDRGRGRGQDRGRGRGRGDFSLPIHQGRGGRGVSPEYQGGGRGRGGGDRGGFGRGRGGPVEVQVFSHGGEASARLDTRVMGIEKEAERAIQLESKKVTSKKLTSDPRLPLRPGFGTRGREVLLWTNHMHLMCRGDLPLYRYSIEIQAGEGGRQPAGKKAKRIVQLLLEEHLSQYHHDIATDYKSTLISKVKLAVEPQGYTVRYRSEDEDEPAENARVYRIRLQATGTLTVSELINHLTSTNFGTMLGSKEEIIQALNIVLGHYPRTSPDIVSLGANRHYHLAAAATEKFALGAGLLAVRGIFSSVRAATARILVNVQVKNGAFYEDGPLERSMYAYMGENGPNKVKLANFLKKVSINVTHIVRKNKKGQPIPRIKVIMGLAVRDDGRGQAHPPIVPEFGAGPKEVKFWLGGESEGSASKPSSGGKGGKKGKKPVKAGPEPPSQGQYVSVYDFFRQTYNIIIKDTSLPVVNVGTRQNPTYLPAQVCEVRPGQPAGTKLSASQTQNMIRFAVRKPVQNAQSIVTTGAQMLGFQPNNSTLRSFGIDVNPQLIVVPGRVLHSPDVQYGNKKTISTKFGSWNMSSVQFATKAELPSWTYLWISSQGERDPWRNDTELRNTLLAFRDSLRQVGINVADPTRGRQITVTPDNAEAQIDATISQFSRIANHPKLLLVILPSALSTIYNRVKYACDVKEGVLNVCVIASKFAKPNNVQYFANVALKFNLKLGGRNQFLDNSKLGILSEGRTMVVGLDVTHPSPGSSSNAPSVASVVASVDGWLAQWPADLKIQPARQEMIEGLDEFFKSRLHLWRKHNDAYPQNILVYRDGVSEGQYNQVLDVELPALRKACKELYPADSTKKGIPNISIIIVGKRHNTRFYPTRKEDADRSSNPQNGTVVDRGVTEARNWDFFLQAHTAIQGTARPAHYYVVYDEIFQKGKIPSPFRNAADVLEDLTHNLCYLFGRATKSVSICPPAYYADLVCDRARCYLSGLFDPSPAASPATSVAGGPPQGVDPASVRIHENVRNVMFYI